MVAHIAHYFVYVYRAMYGWKACCFYEDTSNQEEIGPEQTSYYQHPTPEGAFHVARELAEAYGVKFVPEDSYFKPARNPRTLKVEDGWWVCPDTRCDHKFPAQEKPAECPQCGYRSNPNA